MILVGALVVETKRNTECCSMDLFVHIP